MMRFLRLSLLSLASLAIITAIAASPSFGQAPEERVVPSLPMQEEPWVVSGHPVGDTLGRGIDFLLRPIYTAGSSAWFFVFTPPEIEPITELEMRGCPPILQTPPEAGPAPEPAPAPAPEPGAPPAP
jgi:hypothetical protein